jgi:anti-sigma B factor antagonist
VSADAGYVQLEAQRRGDVTVVRLAAPSDVTARNATLFRERLDAALDGAQHAVLDLDRLDFLDSAGLAALVAAHRAISSRGGDLRLARPGTHVKTVFELVRLHRLFEIHDSVEGAAASFDGIGS